MERDTRKAMEFAQLLNRQHQRAQEMAAELLAQDLAGETPDATQLSPCEVAWQAQRAPAPDAQQVRYGGGS